MENRYAPVHVIASLDYLGRIASLLFLAPLDEVWCLADLVADPYEGGSNVWSEVSLVLDRCIVAMDGETY